MILSSICAMARGRVIGRQGRIPWHLPADLASFRRLTMGRPIIMGRRTFESLGRALPGRTNIVLSRSPDFAVCCGIVCRSLEDALEIAADEEESFIIGGGRLYEQALPMVQRQYLSLLQADIAGDTYYPELDPAQWRVASYRRFPDDVIPWAFLRLDRI